MCRDREEDLDSVGECRSLSSPKNKLILSAKANPQVIFPTKCLLSLTKGLHVDFQFLFAAPPDSISTP